jgi:hypothetical protein
VAGVTGYIRLVAEGGSLQVDSVASTSGTVLDSFSAVPNTGGAGVDTGSASNGGLSIAAAPGPAGGRADTVPAPVPAGGGAGTDPGPAPWSAPALHLRMSRSPRRRRRHPHLLWRPGPAAPGGGAATQAATSVGLQGEPGTVDGGAGRTLWSRLARCGPGRKPVDLRTAAGSDGGDMAAPAAAP